MDSDAPKPPFRFDQQPDQTNWALGDIGQYLVPHGESNNVGHYVRAFDDDQQLALAMPPEWRSVAVPSFIPPQKNPANKPFHPAYEYGLTLWLHDSLRTAGGKHGDPRRLRAELEAMATECCETLQMRHAFQPVKGHRELAPLDFRVYIPDEELRLRLASRGVHVSAGLMLATTRENMNNLNEAGRELQTEYNDSRHQRLRSDKGDFLDHSVRVNGQRKTLDPRQLALDDIVPFIRDQKLYSANSLGILEIEQPWGEKSHGSMHLPLTYDTHQQKGLEHPLEHALVLWIEPTYRLPYKKSRYNGAASASQKLVNTEIDHFGTSLQKLTGCRLRWPMMDSGDRAQPSALLIFADAKDQKHVLQRVQQLIEEKKEQLRNDAQGTRYGR